MTEERKHPRIVLLSTVIPVVVLVGYPLSLGPINWLFMHCPRGEYTAPWLSLAYSLYILPALYISEKSDLFGNVVQFSLDLCADSGEGEIAPAAPAPADDGACESAGLTQLDAEL